MKKLTAVLLLLAVLLSLAACAPSGASNPIDFGKKYIRSEGQYYVFESDGTGVYELHNGKLSGRVTFVWREASDGAVYLFRTGETHDEGHMEGEIITIITAPIHFGEDFFAYDNAAGSAVRYVKEGSELAEALED